MTLQRAVTGAALRNLIARPAARAATIQAVIAVSNLIVGILAARLLPVSERGFAAGLIAWATTSLYLSDLGSSYALQHFSAKRQMDLRDVLQRGMFRGLFAISVVVPAVALYLYAESLALALLFGCVYGAANTVARRSNALVLGSQKFDRYNKLRLTQSLAWLCLGTLSASIFQSATAYVVAFGLSWVLIALPSYRSVQDGNTREQPQEDAHTPPRRFWRYATFGFVGSQNFAETLRLDLLSCSVLLSHTQTAAAAIALSYSAQVRFIALAVAPILHVRSSATSRGQLRSIRVYVGATLVVALIFGGSAAFVIPFVFGEQYEMAVTIASIACTAAFFSSIRSMLGETLRGSGRARGTVVLEGTLGLFFLLAVGSAHQADLLNVTMVFITVAVCQMIGAMASLELTRRHLRLEEKNCSTY